MYATSEFDVTGGKQRDTWTDVSYQGGTDTRCFIWKIPQPDHSNLYTGAVCAKEYDNNSVTMNLKRYINDELVNDFNRTYSVNDSRDNTYDSYISTTFHFNSDQYQKMQTNFPIFKYDPDDPESVDAVKRYI